MKQTLLVVALLLLACGAYADGLNIPPYAMFNTTLPQARLQTDAEPGAALWLQPADFRTGQPSGWLFGAGVDHHKYSGAGNTVAFDARLWVHSSNPTQPGDQLVGANTFAFTDSGGSIYGLNAYAGYYGGSAYGMAHGAEIDTDVRAPAARKVGALVGDVSTSTQHGSSKDAGIWITKQPGAAGYLHAIDVSGEASSGALYPTTVDILNASGGSIPRGIDFSGMAFSDQAIKLPSGVASGAIQWGAGPNRITSYGNVITIAGAGVQGVAINIEGDQVRLRRSDGSCWQFNWSYGTFTGCTP